MVGKGSNPAPTAPKVPSIWSDLADAWPGPSGWRGLHLAICATAILIVYTNLAAMRVENGSVDNCDPVTTYGEITKEGMEALRRMDGGRGGRFLDIGSGNGAFVLWAVTEGGFDQSIGVEMQAQRHEEALKLRKSAGSGASATFVRGDVLEHLELISGVRVVFWNNLCFPREAVRPVAKQFLTSAAEGARLFTLAELSPEEVAGLRAESGSVLNVTRGQEQLQMSWRSAGYHPFVYSRL